MSASRQATLSTYFAKGPVDLAPILTNLNGDNSWLISFPIPPAERTERGKAYYHIVSDCWLQGTQSQVSYWLVNIGLPSAAAVTRGSEVDALVQEIEDAAREAGIIPKTVAAGTKSEVAATLDAIFCNFHYPDHLSEATLRTFAREIAVFATAEAIATVQGWKHFETVVVTKDLDPTDKDWQSLHPGDPLPHWLSVFRMVGHHELNFATAMVWSSGPNLETQQALVYSPHGIRVEQPTLQAFCHKIEPPIKVHGIIHALHDSFAFGMRTTLGVAGGLALEREMRPKYWFTSHDAELVYGGFVARFITEIARTIESGVEELLGKKGKEEHTEEDARIPNVITVDNGGCFVAE